MQFYFFLEGDNVLSAQINDCVKKFEINYENYDHLLRIISLIIYVELMAPE